MSAMDTTFAGMTGLSYSFLHIWLLPLSLRFSRLRGVRPKHVIWHDLIFTRYTLNITRSDLRSQYLRRYFTHEPRRNIPRRSGVSVGPDLSMVSAIERGRKSMKRKLTLLLITGLVLTGALGASPANAACTPTGFIRDGMNMTAKVIADGDISGQTIDASGCNIGIYYGPGTSGTVESS